MDTAFIWELIGYAGSLIVLISLLMSSLIKLRILNLIGSLIFCVYALVIHSIPTALMNAAIVVIDLVFLVKLLNAKTSFHITEVHAGDSSLRNLFRLYKKDIEGYFGKVNLNQADLIYAVFDGDKLAGVTAGKVEGGAFLVMMDYSTPQYRDCSVGKCVCAELAKKVKSMVYTGSNAAHIDYVKKMGYEQQGSRYVKSL